jgi:UDPglucose 6-dehydrogenase
VSEAVCVIGSGYVGLTTAACFAHLGHRVTCTDIDEARVERLRAGECPILEQGLDELLAEGIASGLLTFTTDNGAAAEATFTYLCVPTPQGDDGSADLSYIEAAAREIGPVLQPGSVVRRCTTSCTPTGS